MTKKLKSTLCAVLMICTMTLPQLAYAAPSASADLPAENQIVQQAEQNDELPDVGSEEAGNTDERISKLPNLTVAKYVVSGVALVIGASLLIVLKKKSK